MARATPAAARQTLAACPEEWSACRDARLRQWRMMSFTHFSTAPVMKTSAAGRGAQAALKLTRHALV